MASELHDGYGYLGRSFSGARKFTYADINHILYAKLFETLSIVPPIVHYTDIVAKTTMRNDGHRCKSRLRRLLRNSTRPFG